VKLNPWPDPAKVGCSHIYWDEGSITGEDFMGIGALTVDARYAAELDGAVKAIRRGTLIERREAKWGNICPKSFPAYAELVQFAFDEMKANRMAFGCLVLNADDIDYGEHHAGSPHLGMLRFASTLIAYRSIQFIRPTDRIVVFPDDKSTNVCFDNARNALQGMIGKVYPHRRNFITAVRPLNSKKSRMGQLNDVLIGAVMYHWNQWHKKDNSKQCKCDLAQIVAANAGLSHLAIETPTTSRFSIWELALDTAHKKSAPMPSRLRDDSRWRSNSSDLGGLA